MRAALATTFIFCLLAGCSGQPNEAPRVPVYPVEGKLIVGDRLAGNSRVVFHPVDKGNSIPLYPVANTRPDGSFRLMTYTAGDGAPAGEYIVTVVWVNEVIPIDECEGIDLMTHDRLCGLYADPATSTLRATVHPGHNEITIQAAPGGRGWNLPPLKDARKDDRPPNELELRERGKRQEK
jgi:hypothetical protein